MKIEMIPVEKIIPYWNNARNNKKTVKVVEKSIQKYGFNQPIAIDQKGEIIAGHTRYFAAMNLGMKEVPCIRLALTEQQCKQYRIADNKTHEYSTWDEERLLKELRSMESTFELQDFFFEPIDAMIGFTSNAQTVYNADTDEEPGDEEPRAAETAKSQEKFDQNVGKLHESMQQRPNEYWEFECPHCGKMVTIRK